ncbi:PfkB family carbohydrate kinase [Microbacterium suaedae]|uniref:PfkB family carbohydrate kinase n=1 Tax=Microbacterium suaedae TaxID=2067813 RepID=UPI0013A6075A|nr:PfkB family carbohydrate kinase [Microbacterium suaedae]
MNLAPSPASPRSLVIGEALIDEVRASDGRTSRTPGGSPFNVAIGLARLGVDVGLLAHIGDDEDGRVLAARLEADGVTDVGEAHGTSSVAAARLADDGSASYDFQISWDPRPRPETWETPWTHVHIGSFTAFFDETLPLLERALAGSADPLVTFDPNIRADLIGEREAAVRRVHELASSAHIVKLSDEDAGWIFPGLPLDDVATRLLADGPSLVAITRGGEGSLLATAQERVSLKAPRVSVVDTIGAGDSYMSALAAHVIARGDSLADYGRDDLAAAGDAAQRAAAITVTRRGANPPTSAELSRPARPAAAT